jgi:hypothetical protein
MESTPRRAFAAALELQTTKGTMTNPEPTNPEPTNPEPEHAEPTNPEYSEPTNPEHWKMSCGHFADDLDATCDLCETMRAARQTLSDVHANLARGLVCMRCKATEGPPGAALDAGFCASCKDHLSAVEGSRAFVAELIGAEPEHAERRFKALAAAANAERLAAIKFIADQIDPLVTHEFEPGKTFGPVRKSTLAEILARPAFPAELSVALSTNGFGVSQCLRSGENAERGRTRCGQDYWTVERCRTTPPEPGELRALPWERAPGSFLFLASQCETCSALLAAELARSIAAELGSSAQE